MTFFKDWLVTSEQDELLFENALQHIQKRHIINETSDFLIKLFKILENDNEEEEEDLENLPTNDWDRPGAELAQPIEDFSDEEEEEGWEKEWWKNPKVFLSNYTSPKLAEILSDEDFKNTLNELYKYIKNSSFYLRSKEIEKFKSLFVDHQNYVQALISKQNSGEKISPREIAELNDKKQRILQYLKKLGYCSGETLNQKQQKYEFSEKTKDCISACLNEKNEYGDFVFDQEEFEKKKSEFMQMIEIVLTKKVNKMKRTLSLQNPPIDPDDFKSKVRNLILNKAMSRITLTGRLRSEKDWKSLNFDNQDRGFLGYVLASTGRNTIMKFHSMDNTQKGGRGDTKNFKPRITTDLRLNNKDIFDVYRYAFLPGVEQDAISRKILNKNGKIGKANKTRMEISSYLRQFIENDETLDISMVEDDESLKVVLKLFANNFRLASGSVASLDSMADDDEGSNLDLVTSSGKKAKVPRSMAFAGDEDIIGSSKGGSDLNVSKISQETNPVVLAVHKAFDKLINDPPPAMKQQKMYSEKLQRDVYYNELLALIVAIKYGIGYEITPTGNLRMDPTQGITISRAHGEKSIEISRILKEKLGIDINPSSLRGQKWMGAAENFMRAQLSNFTYDESLRLFKIDSFFQI